jgi:pimeloyl-ACP methyl ester carboxylesterase
MTFVSFVAVDDTTLEGDFREGQRPRGVILSHMHGGSHEDWDDFADSLVANGYAVLKYDFRRTGDVQDDDDVERAPIDLRAALAFMQSRDIEEIFLVGASMGGTASLIVAADGDPDILGVVAMGAPARYLGMDAVAVARNVQVPVLFIVSAEDTEGPAEAQLMSADMTADNETMVLDGALHGTDLLSGPDAEAVTARILAFLDGQ